MGAAEPNARVRAKRRGRVIAAPQNIYSGGVFYAPPVEYRGKYYIWPYTPIKIANLENKSAYILSKKGFEGSKTVQIGVLGIY